MATVLIASSCTSGQTSTPVTTVAAPASAAAPSTVPVTTAAPATSATTAAAVAAAPTTTAPATTTPATTVAPVTTTAAATTSAPAASPKPAATGARPYDVFVPKSYDGSTAVPLIISLHGYTSSGAKQDLYFKLQPLAEQRGFLYIHPDGTKDTSGNPFWNATDACCDLGAVGTDDAAYLLSMIEQVQQKYKVDAKRIYFVGHSNGAFMSYRMACDHADKIAAIVSLAGATFADPARCKPSQPVSVLQVHGTADNVIAYKGGQILGHTFPPAEKTVSTWAGLDGCGETPAASPNKLNLDDKLEGDDASISTFTGCKSGTSVELWTIKDGAHSPNLSAAFSSGLVDFLYAHPKP
jgi:polyhydroxybutyrate depolymerase